MDSHVPPRWDTTLWTRSLPRRKCACAHTFTSRSRRRRLARAALPPARPLPLLPAPPTVVCASRTTWIRCSVDCGFLGLPKRTRGPTPTLSPIMGWAWSVGPGSAPRPPTWPRGEVVRTVPPPRLRAREALARNRRSSRTPTYLHRAHARAREATTRPDVPRRGALFASVCGEVDRDGSGDDRNPRCRESHVANAYRACARQLARGYPNPLGAMTVVGPGRGAPLPRTISSKSARLPDSGNRSTGPRDGVCDAEPDTRRRS